MKQKEIKELQAKTTKELWNMLKGLRKDLLDLRLELSQNKLKNARQLSRKKDDVARVLTILKIKESLKESGLKKGKKEVTK